MDDLLLSRAVRRGRRMKQAGVRLHGMNAPMAKSENKLGNEQGNCGSREAPKCTYSSLRSEFLPQLP